MDIKVKAVLGEKVKVTETKEELNPCDPCIDIQK